MTLARVGGGQFRDWRKTEPVLQSVTELAKIPVYRNRAGLAGLGLLAVSMLILPIGFNKLPDTVKGALLAGAALNFGALSLLAIASTEGEKIWAATKTAQRESFKESLRTAVQVDLMHGEVQKQVAAFEFVQRLPEQFQPHFMAMYDLHGLAPQPVQMQAEVEERGSIAVNPYANSSEQDYYEAELVKEYIQPDWITPDLILASKFIFAPKGSGKTCWLTYEAVETLRLFPGITLWICDIHYDEDESNWLPGVPQDVLEKHYLFRTAETILKRFRMARQILRDRAAKGLKKEAPVKLLCDEFDGLMRRLSEGDKQEVAEIVQEIEDEGRKYKVFQTLVAHSGKQKQIVIDSTAINQMCIMAMGNALADQNTRLPDDMDTKALLKCQQMIQDSIPPLPGHPLQQMARAIVLRKLNESADVVCIPHPSILLEGCVLQVEGQPAAVEEPVQDVWGEPTVEDPMLALKVWFQGCKEEPSESAIAQKFHELTGRPWNQNAAAMAYLKDMLRQP